MEAVYRQKDGRCLLLFDSGNRIQVMIAQNAWSVRVGTLCEDYHSEGVSSEVDGNIYVAYLNTENKLIFDRVFSDERIVLAAGKVRETISDVQIAVMTGETPRLFVWYQNRSAEDGRNYLYAVDALGERKIRIVVQTTDQIERYAVIQHDGVTYLRYRLTQEEKDRMYAVDVSHLGDINLTEYILCKEQTLQELAIRCKENDKIFQSELRKKQTEYEKRLKETAETMETAYKTQYEELSKLTKGMQEEGRKWRELYYKSITKS